MPFFAYGIFRRIEGQGDGDTHAPAGSALGGHRAAVVLYGAFDQVQAVALTAHMVASLVVGLKDVGSLLGGETQAVILYEDGGVGFQLQYPDGDGTGTAHVLQGVFQQVEQHPAQ